MECRRVIVVVRLMYVHVRVRAFVSIVLVVSFMCDSVVHGFVKILLASFVCVVVLVIDYFQNVLSRWV